MTVGIISPAVLEWAERVKPGARLASCTVRPLSGGSVARRVAQVTLHLAGSDDPLELVRKDAPAHEIAGLRAAQALRPGAALDRIDRALHQLGSLDPPAKRRSR